MSFFSSLGKIAQKVVGYVAPLTNLIPGVGGVVAGAVASAIPKPKTAPLTTAGSTAGGLVQTLPTLGGPMTGGTGTPTPQGLMAQLGTAAGQFARAGVAGLTGGAVAGRGATRTKVGKLTGNYIPAGYVERMSPSGVIYLAKQRRGRGISSRDIRSFYRVHRLVAKIHGRAERRPPRRK